jgi:hypothetical protein
MRTVVDTDFLSAFLKINRVELIYEALETDIQPGNREDYCYNEI